MKIKPAVLEFLATYAGTIKLFLYGAPLLVACLGGLWAYNKWVCREKKQNVTESNAKAALMGVDAKSKKRVYLHEEFRKGHMQVIGATSSGKTESAIFPLIIQDIENGSGMVIIDGKADDSFLNKLYAYTCTNGRQADFRLFSLATPNKSWSFNPMEGGSHHEIVERAYSIFDFDSEYYKSIQHQTFSGLVQLLLEVGERPSFYLVRNLMWNPELIRSMLEKSRSPALCRDLMQYVDMKPEERRKAMSGLDAQMAMFTTGEMASLFMSGESSFSFPEAMAKNQIIYFQLPTMLYQSLAAKMGKMVLQCLQGAVATRQLGLNKEDKKAFFACFLDDFQDYIYDGFGTLLNKSRSANLGITFAHQSLGDLSKVSDSFQDVVTTNTNTKIVLRVNDPESANHFANAFGTKTVQKLTSRVDSGVLGQQETGMGSMREAEEYNYHPNEIKSLPRGQGILSIGHPDGVQTQKVHFSMRPDLDSPALPRIFKQEAEQKWDDLKSKFEILGGAKGGTQPSNRKVLKMEERS